MKISSYIHPVRSFLPCSGVGRHINGVLLELAKQQGVDLELWFSKQWLGEDGKLPSNCPLRELPFRTFAAKENLQERWWKLFGWPTIDRHFTKTDFVYCPAETFLPLKHIPWAATIHDIHPFETDLPWSDTKEHLRRRRKWSHWIHRTLRDAAIVFTVSEFSKQRMVELLNADPDKIVVVGNGVDEVYFQPVEETDMPTGYSRHDLLVIGGLKTAKGAEHVLALARRLKQANSRARIVVAGTNESAWEQASRDLENVICLGLISDEELKRRLFHAMALLFLSPYEGFGIPALEAMALGTPVIAANRASLPEIVGDCGYLVELGEVDELVNLAETLSTDNSAAQQYAEPGRERAQQFTWQRSAMQVMEALQRRF